MSTRGLYARLAFLLPGLEAMSLAPIARQLEGHIRLLASRSWSALLADCARALPADRAAALHPPGLPVPDPDLLLASLGHTVSPALLLRLPLPDREVVAVALLAHPDAHIREQTLDGLADGATTGRAPLATTGCAPLHDACAAWSRRMLMAELGRLTRLSHTDRLSLQGLLARGSRTPAGPGTPGANASGPNPPGVISPIRGEPHEAETAGLGDALRTGANRTATTLLAQRAGFAPAAVEVAIALRTPKLLVALCWKAGCDPAETLAVQLQLGRVPPARVLRAGPESRWPLDEAAMQRQIGMLEELTAAPS